MDVQYKRVKVLTVQDIWDDIFSYMLVHPAYWMESGFCKAKYKRINKKFVSMQAKYLKKPSVPKKNRPRVPLVG